MLVLVGVGGGGGGGGGMWQTFCVSKPDIELIHGTIIINKI